MKTKHTYRRLLLLFVMLIGVMHHYAQEVTIIVSGLHNTIPIELDTIKLHNLSNGTAAAITDLPQGVNNYKINLSQGVYSSVGEIPGSQEDVLLYISTPASTMLLVILKKRQSIRVTLFDPAGRTLLAKTITCQPGNNLIGVRSPVVSIVRVSSQTISKTFKVIGSGYNNLLSIENIGVTNIDNPGLLKTDLFYSNYFYSPGDSMKIIACKNNYHQGFIVKIPEDLDQYQVFLSQPCEGYESLTDFDGNTYNTVQIGNQCWMKENLKTTRYADGTPLVDGTGIPTIDITTKYWFNYNDDPEIAETYGKLYSWAAVMNDEPSSNIVPSGVQGVCPEGWHVPSKAEWAILVNYLGGPNVAGGKLKECGYEHWDYPNTGANNQSGFQALPGGRLFFTDYISIYQSGNFSVCTLDLYFDAYVFALGNTWSSIWCGTDAGTQQNGHSVRCLKD